jgi:exonuclease SbcD
MGIRFLHTGDLHLGYDFSKSGMAEESARLRRDDLKQTFNSIIDMAIEKQVDMLLIAGDLFEHRYAAKPLIKFIDDGFRKLKDIPVFIAPGNHDPRTADSYYNTYPWSSNVHIFGARWSHVDLPWLNARVWGWGFETYTVKDDVFRRFPSLPKDGVINIIVVHGSDTRVLPHDCADYLPFTPESIELTGADYTALGHYHRGRPVLTRSGNHKACYCGCPEGLGFDEPGDRGVMLVELDSRKSKVDFVKTSRRTYRHAEVDITGALTLDDVSSKVLASIPVDIRRQDMFEIKLTGEVDPEFVLDEPELARILKDEFFFYRLKTELYHGYDTENLNPETLTGRFVIKMKHLIVEAEDEEHKAMLKLALKYGLDALVLGKVGQA